jgi:hypothetical protein
MQIAEHFVILADFLNETSLTLERWARESKDGSWSTHQVDANRALADQCRKQAQLCIQLAGQTVVT